MKHLPAATVALALIASACGEVGPGRSARADIADEARSSSTSEVASTGDWYRPRPGTTWQWQLAGELDTSHDVEVYDVDLFDTERSAIAELQADGRRVICYFSAGSSEDWRDDVTDFAARDLGRPLDGWDGERWLDVRSAGVLSVMLARLDVAVAKGCDGVEPDNVSAYRNDTGFDISAADQVGYQRALADAAHERGLAIGLKNGGELIAELLDDVDFAVNEECHEYDECDQYRAFVEAGKPVFNAEYRTEWVRSEAARAAMCAQASSTGLSTLVLPVELDGSFRFAC